MIRILFVVFFLAACGPIPVQISQQKQAQEQQQSVTSTSTQSQGQESSHASEARQGTNSMPVIIICNMNTVTGSKCITPKSDGSLQQKLDRNFGK